MRFLIPLVVVVGCFEDGVRGEKGSGNKGDKPWEGTRNLQLSISGYGKVCDLWWDTTGAATSEECPDCDFTYKVSAEFVDDTLGGCDAVSDVMLLGYMPDYDFGEYGVVDVMMYEYSGEWLPSFIADFDGSHLEYYLDWAQEFSGYSYNYSWLGVAEID